MRQQAGVPSVLVVDDHPLWRRTVRSLLISSGAASEVWEAPDGLTAVSLARKHHPDVVLMDMALPGMSGVEATGAVVAGDANTRVLVLSSSDDTDQVLEAVRAGASGYLLKTAEPEEIVQAVQRVHHGELVFPAALSSVLRRGILDERSNGPSPLDELSDRERDVLRLMAEGCTNAGIGQKLHLSAKTVERHVTTIFTKLGLDSAAGGHRRVLAVISYLRATALKRATPDRGVG
ncbi:MAG: hypothetical protein QOJ92_1446 [Frankiales bacterium]|nr:hypothetical protein [Frankiales bacterium]